MAPSTLWEGVWLSSNGNHSISGWMVSRNASVSFSKAQSHVRITSTFSSDIARSVSRDGDETRAESGRDLAEVVDQRQEDARSQSERSVSHDSAQVAFHWIIRHL